MSQEQNEETLLSIIDRKFRDPQKLEIDLKMALSSFYPELFIHPEFGIEAQRDKLRLIDISQPCSYFQFVDAFLEPISETSKKFVKSGKNPNQCLTKYLHQCKATEIVEMINLAAIEEKIDTRQYKLQLLKKEFKKYQTNNKKKKGYPFSGVKSEKEFDDLLKDS